MLGHVSFGVRDLGRAGAFYDAVLGVLGWSRLRDHERGLAYGPAGGGEKLNLFARADATPPGPGFHLAFNAADRAAVDAFHTRGLEAGGRDEGTPGPRPHYGPSYYAAFLRDPDGYKLEIVHQ